MADFVTVIPSYKRHKTLIEKTMKYLEKTTIDLKDVYIFVADPEEYKEYAHKLPKDKYKLLCTGVRGISQQRNYIQRYFDPGTNIFMIDDDIKSLQIKEDIAGKHKSRDLLDLKKFVSMAFDLTIEKGLRFWGTSAVANPFYMKHGISFDLLYIVGNVIGIVNSNDRRIMVDEGLECKARANYSAGKESHERVVKYFACDKGVVRFNHIAPESKYWEGEGGHQVSRNAEGEKAVSIWLQQKYPQYLKLVQRPNGMTDLKVRKSKGKYLPISGKAMEPWLHL